MAENGPRLPISGGGRIIPGVYDIENFYFSVRPVLSNTVPTDTYRGAGRPEANFLMERLMDKAAEVTGLSREEVRRRNVIRPDQMPYRTQMGMVIDSGDFASNMDMAIKAADWDNFPKRRAESEKRGLLRGIGLSNFVEASGGRPTEEMRIQVDANGRRRSSPARIRTGRDTKPSGRNCSRHFWAFRSRTCRWSRAIHRPCRRAPPARSARARHGWAASACSVRPSESSKKARRSPPI